MTPEQERKANDYANALLDRLTEAGSDEDIVAICKETEKGVMRLQEIGSPRFHHIVNWVKYRRLRFARQKEAAAREREKQNQAQQDMFR